MTTTFKCAAVLMLVLALSGQAAWGQIPNSVSASGDFSKPSSQGWIGERPGGGFDLEADLGGPTEITHDPAAGPYMKLLLIQAVRPARHVFTIHEVFIVGINSPPITDWHEVLIDPRGFEWTDDPHLLTLNPGPAETPLAPTGRTADEIWWDFPIPMAPGSTFEITKYLIWDPQAQFGDYIPQDSPVPKVAEYPTIPEPATMGLLAIGGLLALKRRRRRR